jgi:hypothetical protein
LFPGCFLEDLFTCYVFHLGWFRFLKDFVCSFLKDFVPFLLKILCISQEYCAFCFVLSVCSRARVFPHELVNVKEGKRKGVCRSSMIMLFFLSYLFNYFATENGECGTTRVLRDIIISLWESHEYKYG